MLHLLRRIFHFVHQRSEVGRSYARAVTEHAGVSNLPVPSHPSRPRFVLLDSSLSLSLGTDRHRPAPPGTDRLRTSRAPAPHRHIAHARTCTCSARAAAHLHAQVHAHLAAWPPVRAPAHMLLNTYAIADTLTHLRARTHARLQDLISRIEAPVDGRLCYAQRKYTFMKWECMPTMQGLPFITIRCALDQVSGSDVPRVLSKLWRPVQQVVSYPKLE